MISAFCLLQALRGKPNADSTTGKAATWQGLHGLTGQADCQNQPVQKRGSYPQARKPATTRV